MIATKVGGVHGVVRDNETGLLVPPSNSEALAERMGLTRERIRQIQQEALQKLKRHMASHGIDRDSIF